MDKSQILREVQTIMNYRCSNTDKLWEALSAAGAKFDCEFAPVPLDGNKRLAMVGDAVLKMVLMKDWYPTGSVRGSSQAALKPGVSADDICRTRGGYHAASSYQPEP